MTQSDLQQLNPKQLIELLMLQCRAALQFIMEKDPKRWSRPISSHPSPIPSVEPLFTVGDFEIRARFSDRRASVIGLEDLGDGQGMREVSEGKA